jgi:hypothetical protein
MTLTITPERAEVCADVCAHIGRCDAVREFVEAACALCGEPIGYGAAVFQAGRRHLVHQDCILAPPRHLDHTRTAGGCPMRLIEAARLAGLLISAAWRWRVELAAVLVAVTVWSCLSILMPRPVAALLAVTLLASALAPARMRAQWGWIWRRARLRRRWARACRHAGLETFNERVPGSPGSPGCRSGRCCGCGCPPANPPPTW